MVKIIDDDDVDEDGYHDDVNDDDKITITS
jgi:hypothetical protein